MKHGRSHRRFVITTGLISLLGVGAVASESPLPQETEQPAPFVVYFDDGPFPTSGLVRDEATYIPLTGLVRRMALPYTDATGVGSFTIRGPLGTLTAMDGEDRLNVDGRTLELEVAPFRDGTRWFVPIEFLTTGLEQITGVDFQYEPGAPRILAGILRATALAITAVGNEGETRLTIRSALGVNVRVQQLREENRVILSIDRSPMSPAEEVLDYRDASVRSVRFDDADGRSKIVVETTSQVASVRLTPTDANRTFFVDFVPESAPARPIASPTDREGLVSSDEVRVIVIDPGHGGLDGGVQASGTQEKDLTLTLARGIRTRLQREIDTTVILTRDADLELSGETRSAIANNSGADLMISLHVGFSSDPTELGASLFVMKDMQDEERVEAPLFRPWYGMHQDHLRQSRRLGEILQRNLTRAIPGWEFPLREAPISVLTSAGMPAILLEVGNANNPSNLVTLIDQGFQRRLIEAIVESVSEFGAPREGATP